MDRRLRTSRLIFRTTSTSSGIGCRRGATSRRRCDEWIFRRWMAVRARWFQLSRIESPRKLSVATLSRVWSRRSTPTPMATGPANRRSMPCAKLVSVVGRYDWVLDLDVKAYFDSIDWEPSGGPSSYEPAVGAALY